MEIEYVHITTSHIQDIFQSIPLNVMGYDLMGSFGQSLTYSLKQFNSHVPYEEFIIFLKECAYRGRFYCIEMLNVYIFYHEKWYKTCRHSTSRYGKKRPQEYDFFF